MDINKTIVELVRSQETYFNYGKDMIHIFVNSEGYYDIEIYFSLDVDTFKKLENSGKEIEPDDYACCTGSARDAINWFLSDDDYSESPLELKNKISNRKNLLLNVIESLVEEKIYLVRDSITDWKLESEAFNEIAKMTLSEAEDKVTMNEEYPGVKFDHKKAIKIINKLLKTNWEIILKLKKNVNTNNSYCIKL